MAVISGELENVWLAAKSDKRLKKTHYTETELRNAVKRVIQNTDKRFTLQLQAQLLVGIVRIYQKKMNYLSDDCRDAMKSSFHAEKKKKLMLQPEKSRGSSKKAKHLQDASQIDALWELPDLSLSELHAKLEEEALIQRSDAHQARESELQMDEYLLDQPNEATGLEDLEDDGFDYTFDLGLDVNKILKSVVDDGFSGDLASLLESAPIRMDDEQDGDDDSGGMQQESEEFHPPPVFPVQTPPEREDEYMQEPEEPAPLFNEQPQFQELESFQEPESFQQPEVPEAIDEVPQEAEQPSYQEEQPEEQLVSPVQPEPSNFNEDYNSAYQNEMHYQMPDQSFENHEEAPERSTVDLVHKSYEANDEVQFKDAGELPLMKDDEEWYEPEDERIYRYQTENLDAQEEISDFSEGEYVDTSSPTPRKNKKTPKKRKKNFTPKKRNRKRKKNFRDEITELTSEWIRDSISNTTAIIYKKRPSVELTRYPGHLHDRSKDGMDSLIETPFVHGLAPQLLKMFQQKVWTRCHTFTNRDYLAEPESGEDYDGYNEDYGDYQLAGDPDLGDAEEQYLSDGDEPPRKRMKTHHEVEEVMNHQPHESLPPEVGHEEHEVGHEEHEEGHEEHEVGREEHEVGHEEHEVGHEEHEVDHEEHEVDRGEHEVGHEDDEAIHQEEDVMADEEPPQEPFEPSIPQDAEPDLRGTIAPQQREMTIEQSALQDGFTYKTLQTMQFLGSQEERTLSFKSLTEGQSCKVAAGLFYELLVIRSKGMVQLDQPEPYGDTQISKCDQFDDFLQV